MGSLNEELLDRVRGELVGQVEHDTRIERVELTIGEDADGNPALFVNLTLTDPADGETWPTDDVQALRRRVRDVVLELLHEEVLRWYVNFAPETAPDVDDSDIASAT
jgi:hypothetical protein